MIKCLFAKVKNVIHMLAYDATGCSSEQFLKLSLPASDAFTTPTHKQEHMN